MKHTFVPLLAAVCLGAIPSLPRGAKPLYLMPPVAHKPSLAATDLWLRSNLPRIGLTNNPFEFIDDYATYTIDGCSLTITIEERITPHTYINMPPDPANQLWHLEFSPATGETFTSMYRGDLGRAVISFRGISPSYSRIEKDAKTAALPAISIGPKMLNLSFVYRSKAERVRRAMLHAIALCGGKPDVF